MVESLSNWSASALRWVGSVLNAGADLLEHDATVAPSAANCDEYVSDLRHRVQSRCYWC